MTYLLRTPEYISATLDGDQTYSSGGTIDFGTESSASVLSVSGTGVFSTLKANRTYELTASCMLSASNVAEIRAQWYDSTGAALMGAVAVWRTTTAGSHDGIQCIAKAIWTPSVDSFALVQMLASGTAGTTLKQIGSWAQIVELSR